VAEEFDVSTDITAVGTPYLGYQMSIEFDGEILEFVPVEPPMNIIYTGLGMMQLDLVALLQDDDSDGRPEVYGGSARYTGHSEATGRANYVRFRCTAPGTTPLHLLTSSESTAFYTTTVGPSFDFIPTVLQDAAITCSSAAASPTPTATALPSVGGIADLPASGMRQAGPAGASTTGPGSRAATAMTLALTASGVVATAVVAWYATRRRSG
jgi:hypothetical protein